MIALIDGDIVAYRCAASAENDPKEIAILRVDSLINNILDSTNADNYKIFIGAGEDNFRYTVYPEYKANRLGKPKPFHLDVVRHHLAGEYAATVCTGYEADDFLGIEQTKQQTKSIICSIDKDLLQVPGHHWNFVKENHRFISPFEALRNLYSQGILGDSSDNIPGFDGKLRQKAPQFVQKLIDPLYEMHEEGEMYQYVLSLYSGDVETFHRNMNLLYILREEGVHWQPPNRRSTDGQMEDSIRLSSEFLEAECDAGPPSMQP